MRWTKRHWFWFFVVLVPSWAILGAVMGVVLASQIKEKNHEIEVRLDDQRTHISSLFLSFKLEITSAFHDVFLVMGYANSLAMWECIPPEADAAACAVKRGLLTEYVELFNLRPTWEFFNLTFVNGNGTRTLVHHMNMSVPRNESSYIPGKLTDLTAKDGVFASFGVTNLSCSFGTNNYMFHESLESLFGDNTFVVGPDSECPFTWCADYGTAHPEVCYFPWPCLYYYFVIVCAIIACALSGLSSILLFVPNHREHLKDRVHRPPEINSGPTSNDGNNAA